MLLLSRFREAIGPFFQIFTILRYGYPHALRKQRANASLVGLLNPILWWKYMVSDAFHLILEQADQAWANEKADLVAKAYVSCSQIKTKAFPFMGNHRDGC